MLSKKTIERLAALSGLTVAQYEAAIADTKEVDLEIPETLTVLTAEELTARDTNKIAEGKRLGELEGETKGKELATKVFKTKLGITDASKDPEAVANIAVTKMAGDDALKEQVKLLQNDVKAKEKAMTDLQTQLQGASKDRDLLAILPANKSKALENAEHLSIVKANLEFTTEGVKYKGAILRKANTQDAMSEKEAIDHFYNERKGLLEVTGTPGGGGGRGGGDKGGGAGGDIKTLKDFRLQWMAANPSVTNVMDEGFQMAVREELKKNPAMVMEDDGLDARPIS